MRIVREIDMEAARRGGNSLLEISVPTLAQARMLAHKLVPTPLRENVFIYVRDEGCVVHVGSLEPVSDLRCWTLISQGNPVPISVFTATEFGGHLVLGYLSAKEIGAPLLFPDGLAKEVKEEKTKEGKKEV